MDQPALSVVIPVHREEARIAALLEHLAGIPAPGGAEVLVVDGDPEARTLAAMPPRAMSGVAVGLRSAKGRARQMNAGAAAARGETLLFLHADTRLPENAFALVLEALADPGIVGGAFTLAIEPEDRPPGPALRFITRAANLRARLTRAPFGDQGLFFRRASFEALGGFADIPLMEDLEFMTRLRRRGLAIRLLPQAARTSARRWEAEGLLRCTGRNLFLRTLYHLGVGPEWLARLYT